jgi:uncharacterized repeat protein (TIGR01451 family)
MNVPRLITIAAALLFLMFCLARPASAQIAQDNITTINSNGSTTSLSWFHGVGSGSNRILIVGVSYSGGSVTTSTVTYGLTPLTRIGVQSGTFNQNRTELWYLLAPPTGSSAVAIAVSPAKEVAACAISYTGVNQTTPLNTFVSAAGQSNTASVNVVSAPGELVVDTVSANGDAQYLSVNAGQTQRWTLQTGTFAANVRSGGSSEPGASSQVNMSWTLGQSTTWSIGAVSLKPVPSAPNVVLSKSVSPSGNLQPGTDLAYTVSFTNGGGMAASSLSMTDPVPANTDFKINSEAHSLGTTGLTVTVGYSKDGGTTWTYTPVSGGGGAPAGYDRNVTKIRWVFSGNLSQTSPNNNGSVSFTTRIR